MKKLFMLMLIVPLYFTSACSEKHVEQSVITAESTLTTLEVAALQYKNGELGITPKAEVVSEIEALDDDCYKALVAIRADAQNGKAISAVESTAATTALAALQAYLIKNNIIKN